MAWVGLGAFDASAQSIVEFTSATYIESENAGAALITVRREVSIIGTVTVSYSTSDGTALDGIDYQGVQGNLVFGDGEREATFLVPLIDNFAVSPTRTVNLTLFDPSPGVTLGAITNAVLNITDDESASGVNAGEFQFTSPTYFVSQFEGLVPPITEDHDLRSAPGVIVTVTRANGTYGKVMVDYTTTNLLSDELPPNSEPAVDNIDYVPRSGTLVFNDFQMSTNILIPIRSAGITNVAKRFGVILSNPRPAPGEDPTLVTPRLGFLSDAQVHVNKIISTQPYNPMGDTNAPTNVVNGISFERGTYRVDEYRSEIFIAIRNPEGAAGCFLIDFRAPPQSPQAAGIFQAGSTRAGVADFDLIDTPTPGVMLDNNGLPPRVLRVTWPQNLGRAIFRIAITNDTLVEFNEDIFLQLLTGAGCALPIGNQRLCSVTILHDDQPSGSLDREWNPDNISATPVPFNPLPGPNNTVRAVAVQEDGKTLIGGDFTGVNSIPAQNRIARLNDDGSLDTTFNVGSGANSFVSAIAIHPNINTNSTNAGKIIIAGGFTSVDGEERKGVARLNPDGSLDRTFNPGNGANDIVWSALVVNNDKVVIGGDFTEINGVPRNGIARLNADGSLDMAFDPGAGADGTVWSLAVDKSSQAIQISAGQFGFGPAEFRTNIDTRASAGTLTVIFSPACVPDTLNVYYGPTLIFASGPTNEYLGDPFCDFTNFFGPITYVIPYGPGPYTDITIVVNEGSGDPGTVWQFEASIENSVVGERLMVGGEFTSIDGFPRNGIARLSANGALDLTFDPGGGADGPVYTVAIQPDMKVLVGGAFTEFDVRSRSGIARLNEDGTLDTSFDPGSGFNDSVFSITMSPGVDGQPLVGGVFTEYNGTRRIGLARLFRDGSLDTSFLDTAYNQFAGIINTSSFESENSVHSVAVQEDGKVIIGGSFDRVGGNPSIRKGLRNSFTVFTRSDISPRNNLARLIADWGETGGQPNPFQAPGNLALLEPAYSVDEFASRLAVRLVRTNGVLGPVQVTAGVSENLALPGLDYTNTAAVMAWTPPHPPNPLILFFPVPITDDNLIEGDETLNLHLSNPFGLISLAGELAALGPALGRLRAPLTIIDDDTDQGYFVFSSPIYSTNEGSGTITVNVYRVGGSTRPVSVDYFTANDTASISDYRSQTGRLFFAEGVTNRTITITITNDTTVELDDSFFIVLTNATGGANLGFSSVDPSFNPGTGFNGAVNVLATHTNAANRGKIVVGGEFTSFNGVNRGRIAQLNLNGSLDTSFAAGPSQANSNVNALAILPDGKLLIGGDFTTYGGTPRTRIALLSTEGALDTGFNITGGPTNTVRALAAGSQLFFTTNVFTNFVTTNMMEGTNIIVVTNEVYSTNIITTTNVYLMAGGDFGLIRFGPDGAPDTNYFVPVMLNGAVHSLVVQPTNRTILVGGSFSQVNGQPYNGLVRLRSDFTVDPTFNPVTADGALVRSVDIDSEGRPVIGGLFRIRNNDQINNVARLLVNGALDLAFNPGTGANDEVLSVLVHREGVFLNKVLLGGRFTSVNGHLRNRIARLNVDGLLDTTFAPNPAANDQVKAIATQLDGRVVVGGSFNLFSGLPRNSIARIGPSIATVNIIDDDLAPGRLSFIDASFSTNENNLYATIRVERRGGTFGAIQVTAMTTNGGSATLGTDYTAVTTNLTWVNQESGIKSFRVPIIGDGIVELNETVNLRLVNPTGGAGLGSQSNAVLVIENDDFYGVLAFSQANFETDENGTAAAITIVRTGGSAESVTVTYEASPGTATTADFTPLTNTVTLGPGQVTTNFSIAILPDSGQDGDRTVILRLRNPVNASLGLPNPATLTIVDDESFNIPAGTLDTLFGAAASANNPVYALALQPDGKFLIGGDFTFVNGVTRNRVARINPNGSLDSRFSVGLGPNRPVRAMALQRDGKLVIAGFFNTVHGTNRAGIARLNADGSLDSFFNPGAGANNPVYAVALQNDGRIFIGGSFDTFNGVSRPGIALLNTNGTLNTGFSPLTGVNGTVYAIAAQPDGKVVIGGEFDLVNNVPRVRVARLNADGSLDTTFNPGLGADSTVRAIALQPDQKILIGGSFTTINGTNRNFLARLHPDGSLDTAFLDSVAGGNNAVYAIALQADGKIIVGGDFTTFNGVNRNRITRLNPNGKTDATINFGTGANSFVAALAIQPDRKIILGGGFTVVDDQPRGYFARIHGGSLAGPGNFEFILPFFTVNENAQKALVTIRRRGGTTGDVGITYETFDGTATAGLDYTNIPPTALSFVEGEAVRTVEIPIINDVIVEEPETVGIILSNPTGGAGFGAQPFATLTIVNDDSTISFLTPSFSVAESNISASATITVIRSGATNSAVSVDYLTANQTAIAGIDYLSRSDTLTFAQGETFKRFTVPIIDDLLVEGNESLGLTLTNVTGPAALGSSSANLVIVDNDFAAGQLNFSQAVYVVNEFETNIVITVVRTNGSTGVISVDFATSDGTALAIQDYLPSAGTLSFADGESVKIFSVPIVPDYLDETNETVILALSNVRGGATLGATSTATLTILNSRLINGNLNFSEAAYSVSESNATATITVTRTLGSSGAVSVGYRTLNGTAQAGLDYTGVTNTLAWADGDAAPKTFTVPITNDGIVEATETFGVQLFNPAGGATLGGVQSATVSIRDNDFGAGNLSFASATYSVAENGTNAVINVIRTFGDTGAVSIAYATVPGGTAIPGVHYTNVNDVLTFGPGETNKSFLIPIIDNFIVEVDKTVKIELSLPTGGATTNGQIISAILTIVENDQEAGSVDLSFNNQGANDQIYTIIIQTNNNRLVVGGDFTAFSGVPRSRVARLQPNGSLDNSFDPAGIFTNSVRAIGLQNDGKVVVGGAFTGVPSGSNTLAYLVRLNFDGSLDTNFFSGMTGADNAVFALAVQSDGKIVAGGAFTSVNGALRNHLVRLDTSGTVDLNFNPTAGANGLVRAIVVQNDGRILIGGDFTEVNGVPRNRIARLNANGALDTSFNPGLGASDSVHALALQSDGTILVGGVFTLFNGVPHNRFVRLLENGTVDSSFNAGLGANEFVSSIALQPDGRIVVGGGFTSFNGVPRGGITRLYANGTTDTSINFGRGANNYVSTIAIQSDRKIVIGGGFTEFDGRPRPYIARLNGGENLGPGSLVFTAANYSVVENGTNITITVRRLIGTTNTVTVNFAATGGTAVAGTHFIPTNGVLTFAPGETIKTFNVAVIDDTVTNVNRTVNLTLSNPTGGASLGSPSTATLTIINNDDVLGFNIVFYSVAENAAEAIITVERTGGSVGVVTVDYTTVDGTAAAGSDYIDSFGTLVFGDGQTIQTFAIPIINDTLVEGNESLDLLLSAATGTAVLGQQSATLTIVDDDFSPGLLGFSQPVFNVGERAGFATITVSRGTGSSGAASVDFITANGTATAPLDYSGVSGRLVFADNEIVKTFTIPIFDDVLAEGAETVNLTLFNPIGAALGLTTATLTILGDEALFNFTNAVLTVVESNLFATVTVTRSTDGTGPVAIEFATSNNTAVAGFDYINTNGVLSWAAGDFSARTFTVQIINDQVGELTEDLGLFLVNPVGESAPGPLGMSSLVILDDDSSFSFASTNFFVNEGQTNATITIVRTGFATGAASVTFATGDGTARAGQDYTFTSVTVNFADGETVKTVTVPIIDDAVGEPDETVNLFLQNPSPGSGIGVPGTATLTITENEDVISFAGADFAVDERGTNAIITVVRRGISTGALSVNFATSNGTATAGLDYSNAVGVLNFLPFESFKTISIPILEDSIAEGDETVFIRLFNLAGSAFLVTPTNATLTILDNDVSVRFSSATFSAGENQTNAFITVTRVGAPSTAFSVSVATSNGTATAGVDYTAVSGLLDFGVGEMTRTFVVPLIDDLSIEGNETVNLRLFGATPTNAVSLGAPNTATLTIVDDDASIIVPAGAALISESISPPNGIVDPGEMVTVNFGFRNVGNIDTTSLVATLLNTNGVVPSGTTQRTLGALQAGGPTRSASFTFTANGTNGGRAIATFRMTDGANNLGFVTFTFILGRAQTVFGNSNSITINDATPGSVGLATPYPSSLVVSNLPGTITKVTVTLNNLSHTYPDDIDILLVSPTGQKVVLMSDAGGGNAVNNCILTFDDAASGTLSDSGQIVSGTYRPANFAGAGTADSFPPPAPAGPYNGASLASLVGLNPNGTWSLYVVDDAEGDSGNIAGGWSLGITTSDALAPAADVCITATDFPDPVMIGSDLTYLYRITNYGPATATGVTFTNVLPAGVQYISSVHSTGGSSTFNNGILDCFVGTLPSGAGMTITVVVRPTVIGTLTSTATVRGNEADLNPDNNTASVKTTVNPVLLTVTRQGNQVRLSWPAGVSGFVVQSCNTLPATTWVDVTSPPVQVTGGQNTITLDVQPGERRFFRLRRP